MKKLSSKKGFTIVELVIVIAVLAILAAVLIPTFSTVINNANAAACKQEAESAYKDAYANILKLNAGKLPEEGADAALTTDSSNADWTFVFDNAGLASVTYKGTVYTTDFKMSFTAAGKFTVEYAGGSGNLDAELKLADAR